jgi:hypothetical protein
MATPYRGPECRKIRSISLVAGILGSLSFLPSPVFEACRSLLESEGKVEYFENS